MSKQFFFTDTFTRLCKIDSSTVTKALVFLHLLSFYMSPN